jgi:leader peptidase (prepilin peptidase)/N-methyltransferase
MEFIATSRPPGVVGSIAVRYRLLEVLTAVLFAVVAAVHRHDPAKLVLGLVLVAFLVPISLIDIEHRIIPNRLTVPATVLAIALGTALDPGGEVGRLVAGVVAGAALALPSLLHPSGIGMGDAKLLAVMGLFLGASVAVAFVAAFSAGAVAGAAIMMRRGVAEGRRTAIPFGPFLALGGVAGVLVGDELVNLYLGAF